jgi:hypothetical protein
MRMYPCQREGLNFMTNSCEQMSVFLAALDQVRFNTTDSHNNLTPTDA